MMNHRTSKHRQPRFAQFPDLESDYEIPYSRPSLARLEKDGRFPRRIRLSSNVIVWDRDEIEAWLQARADERDGGGQA